MTKIITSPNDRQNQMIRVVFTLAGVAILIAGLIVISQRNAFHSRPASVPYALQAGQTYISTNQNVFEIKMVVINTQEILFLYVATHHAPTSIGVQAMSVMQTQRAHESLLHSSLQQFGQLGKYDTGVIHVQNINTVGQIIQLKITFPDQKDAPETTNTLQPVIQGSDSSSIHGYAGLGVQSDKIPDVQLAGQPKTSLVSIKGPNGAAIYLKTVAGGNFQVITKEEFLKASK